MIELVIKKFLDSHLTVPAFLEKPSNSPARYVLFEKTGGGKREHICSSTFAFQSYAKTMYEAAEINEEIKQVVEEMIILDSIAKVSLNSDYNFTHTTSKEYRYQAVFDIVHYE